MLKNAIKKPLTTVTAGAGYGKTQAVSTLLRSTQENIIWFQLSELDNLIARFWERFVFGFKPYSKKLASSLRALGYPETLAAFDQFLRLLAKELMRNERFIFVLDDFHFIRDKTILNFIENLIYSRIQKISIIIVSRSQPSLNLATMLSKGLLARIVEDDLRFSQEETRLYYERQGLNLDRDMLSKIYSYTEGWIFAIYLVSLSMKKGNVHELNPLSLSKIDIFELMEKEIFAVASKELQKYLIEISVLDILPKGLLMKLLDYNDAVLAEMTTISLFIRYSSLSDSYRMHHLFRKFLLEKKNRLPDEQILRIHLTAAQWYEKNNSKPEAINHYKECNRYSEIFDIILSGDRHVGQETADSLIKLIEQAPEEIVRARPIIQVLKAYYLLNNNKIDKAYEELTRLREKYERLPPTAENRRVLGEAYIVLALISIINQNFDFEDLFKKADEFLPEGSVLVDYKFNIAEGINVTGIKNPASGELEKYLEALSRAMPHASRVMNGCGYGAEYLNAADSCYMAGDIKGAEKNAYEAIFRAGQKQQYGIECMANFILVRIFVLKGDYAKTVDILRQMKKQLDILQIANIISLYDIIEGWFYVKIGETHKVSKWIKNEEETRKMLPPVIVGREYLVRSDSLLAEGRYDELLAFTRQTDVLYTERGILYAVIQNKITKAILHYYRGDHEDSIHALNEAYELSSPNNLVIQYIEYGNQMRTVLNAAKRDKRCKIPLEWLNTIHTKSSTYAKQLAHLVSEYKNGTLSENKDQVALSKREKEMLSYLCRGLTRGEIASSCNLSLNTVKSVLQSAFNKLGASNSADAIRIATAMDLGR